MGKAMRGRQFGSSWDGGDEEADGEVVGSSSFLY